MCNKPAKERRFGACQYFRHPVPIGQDLALLLFGARPNKRQKTRAQRCALNPKNAMENLRDEVIALLGDLVTNT